LFQIAALATNPFDVVKTHQQIELGEKEIYSGKYTFFYYVGIVTLSM
jgi:uncharacterized protein (DUF1015 family)